MVVKLTGEKREMGNYSGSGRGSGKWKESGSQSTQTGANPSC